MTGLLIWLSVLWANYIEDEKSTWEMVNLYEKGNFDLEKKEGIKKGREEGIIKGKKEGMKKGKEEGEKKTRD